MAIKKEWIVELLSISIVVGLAISYSLVYLFHIAALLYVGYILTLEATSHKSYQVTPLRSKYLVPLYAIIAWYIVSLLWAPSFGTGLRYLAYIFTGLFIICFFLLEGDSLPKQRKIFKWVSVVFVIEVFFSLLEVFTSFRLPVSPYSEYLHLLGRDLSSYQNIDLAYRQELTSLATGFRWNPNNLATTMVIILPFFLLAKKRLAKFGGSGLVIFIVVASQSRSNFLALLLLLSVFSVLFVPKRGLRTFALVFLTSIIGAVSITFYEALFESGTLQRAIQALERYISGDMHVYDSIGIRNALIQDGMAMFRESGGLGVGAGGFEARQSAGGGVLGIHVLHNLWLEKFVNGGVFVGTVFVGWYIAMSFKLWEIQIEAISEELTYYSRALLLSFIAFSVGVIAIASPIYFFPMWIMYGFALMTISNYQRSKKSTVSSYRVRR